MAVARRGVVAGGVSACAPACASASPTGPTRAHNPTCKGHRAGKCPEFIRVSPGSQDEAARVDGFAIRNGETQTLIGVLAASGGGPAGLLGVQAHPADQSLVIQVEDDRLGYVGHDALQLEMLGQLCERHLLPRCVDDALELEPVVGAKSGNDLFQESTYASASVNRSA